MVMRFFYGSPIEDDIGCLTAEDVPNHELDMSEALNFADRVRSKEYSAKDVAYALRSRLEYPNPNAQILALSLADICVKNGGGLIQLELSRREFVDAMASLLDSKTGRDYELRQLVLRLIQEWAALFRGNSEMGYVAGAMERMRRSGYSFPKLSAPASSAMIDTASAPEWVDSPVCQRCRMAFTLTNRKHHCRNCGLCFCNDCSSNSTPIPKFAIYDSVRVCHGCYLRLKKIVPDTDDPNSPPPRSDSRPSPSARAVSADDDNDDELKRAIELSLQEAQKRPNYAEYTLKGRAGTTAPPVASTPAPLPAATAPAFAPAVGARAVAHYPTMASEPYPLTSAPADAPLDDEDDPDLRAAIEASLRDLPEAGAVPDYMPAADSSRQALALNRAPVDEPEDDAPLSAFMPAATIEDEDDRGPLSAAESENVQLFEALLMRIRDSGQDIRFDPQIQYLRESIQQLHPRITGAIESVDQKHTEFIKLHDRIVTAIKIYDQLLDKRLRSSTYIGASTAPPPQSLYPAVPAQQAAFVPSALPHYPPAATTAFYHQDRAIPAAYAAPPEQPAPVSPPQQTPPGMPTLAQHPGASTADLHMLPAGAYAVPPPVSHVPSIPVLQPAARQQVGSLAPPALAPSVQAPAPAPQPAPEPVQEPEEALLIEL